MFSLSSLAIGLSVLLVAMHLPGVLNAAGYRKAIKNFINSDDSVLRLAGGITMLLGFFVLNTYMKIEQNWETVMSVLGWLMLAKGVAYLWNPEGIRKRSKKVLANEGFIAFASLFGLAIGLGLGYLGLYVY